MNLSNEDIRFKQRNDPGLQDIVVDCLNNVPTRDQMFELKEDILYRRKKNGSLVMVVPMGPSRKHSVLTPLQRPLSSHV